MIWDGKKKAKRTSLLSEFFIFQLNVVAKLNKKMKIVSTKIEDNVARYKTQRNPV